MITIQILVILFLTLFIIVFYIGIDNKEYREYNRLLLLLSIATLVAFCVIFIIQNHELSNQLNSKCPQYERVLDVYRLKNQK